MEKALFLSLSLLVAGSSIIPQPVRAINPIALAASGPAVYGLFKLGQYIKGSKKAQTVTKGIAAGISGLATLFSAVLAEDAAHRYMTCSMPSVNYKDLSYKYAAASFIFGLSACLLTQSTINDIKNSNQSHN